MKKFIFKTAHSRAVFFDRFAKHLINIGGIAVIIAVVGILFFILWESAPLLFGASSDKKAEINQTDIIISGVDEYQEIAYFLTDTASIEFVNLEEKQLISSNKIEQISNRKIFSASKDIFQSNISLGLDSGYVALLKVSFKSSFDEKSQRIITPDFEFVQLIRIANTNENVIDVKYSVNSDGFPTVVAKLSDRSLYYYSSEEGFSLMGDGDLTEYNYSLSDYIQTDVKCFVLDSYGTNLAFTDYKNNLSLVSLSDKEEPSLLATKKIVDDDKITTVDYIIGNQTILVGYESGKIDSWQKVKSAVSESGWTLARNHEFKKMQASVVTFSASNRSKGFLAADINGNFNLYFLTSERTLLETKGNGIPITELSFSPKSDGLLVRFGNNNIESYHISNPHPETSMSTLFGKVWYEGYQSPEYVWQSTGGDDSFESKLNLVPLIYGTMKGTIYAMFFAIPLALLGALYTSTFAHPKFRNKIKPFVELMAALPSVVIGFLAGLWLAPMLEKHFPTIIMVFFVIPIMVILSVLLWEKFEFVNKRIKRGYEVFLIIPFLIMGFIISTYLGPIFENIFLGGDYRLWLDHTFNMPYDQRNSLIVGFAMGFAVIPIIFTICEDALATVPKHLTSASLALGATKWQTAVRVVLPTASPGIFSAIMIGFGRAIGETMIVLMATGNTPIMDMSPFNGMRTLAANIAVEIPEAPYHGTLYRVLFVSAALLFILTFLVNTIAEIVRQRLRKKYMHI